MKKIFILAVLLNCLFLTGCEPEPDSGLFCMPTTGTCIPGGEDIYYCFNLENTECALRIGEEGDYIYCEDCENFCSDIDTCDYCPGGYWCNH